MPARTVFILDVMTKSRKTVSMKKIWLVIFVLTFYSSSYSQDKSYGPTYVYDGFIQTDQGHKLKIKLNFLVLLDSTLVGSYYYNPQDGFLKIVGHLNPDNSFQLVERDKNDSITGYFKGIVSSNKKEASGKWTSKYRNKVYSFELSRVEGKSYWDFIKKNRALYEYNDLKLAIKEYDKVLSIDVAEQNLNKLPRELKRLNKIMSCNLLGNQFRTFPTILTKLKTLDEISLSSNKLTEVTPEIGQLKNLRILIMNNNQLTELPEEIGELTKLLYLELGNNQLTTLPEGIQYLTSLQELHLERNKLSDSEKERIKKLLPNCVIHF